MILRLDVGLGPQQREAAALAVHRVLPGREGDVAAGAVAAFPDGEAEQLEAGERTVVEVEFGIRQLAGGAALVVRDDS